MRLSGSPWPRSSGWGGFFWPTACTGIRKTKMQRPRHAMSFARLSARCETSESLELHRCCFRWCLPSQRTWCSWCCSKSSISFAIGTYFAASSHKLMKAELKSAPYSTRRAVWRLDILSILVLVLLVLPFYHTYQSLACAPVCQTFGSSREHLLSTVPHSCSEATRWPLCEVCQRQQHRMPMTLAWLL